MANSIRTQADIAQKTPTHSERSYAIGTQSTDKYKQAGEQPQRLHTITVLWRMIEGEAAYQKSLDNLSKTDTSTVDEEHLFHFH